jgi:hypothetical protein
MGDEAEDDRKRDGWMRSNRTSNFSTSRKKILQTEFCGDKGSEWLTPPLRGINSSLKEKKKKIHIILILA